MCTIIGFSGKIGSGKDYVINNIVVPYLRSINKNVICLAFSDYLKLQCNVKDRILYDRLFIEKDIESRKILQERGTVERTNNPKIFIEAMDCMIKMFSQRGVDIIIISDVRFRNELDYLKNKDAILFRINSPNRTKDKLLKECEGDIKLVNMFSSHISEKELDNSFTDFEYILNNDYIYSLNIEKEITKILTKIIK